jgi:hypothetical protein
MIVSGLLQFFHQPPIPTQRVEEKNWSHFAVRSVNHEPASAGPCEPFRRQSLGTTQTWRGKTNHSHAGYPQGLLTRRFFTYLVSCLADECNRPNCQRNTPLAASRNAPANDQHDLLRPALVLARCRPTDGIGRCKATVEKPAPAVS